MTARWNDGLVLSTAHKDFWIHIGGWLQNDVVAFSQSKNTIKSLGDFQDGDFFRRVRLNMEGGFWQVGEFNTIFGFENTQRSVVSVFELWGGLKDIPLLGTVRIGRMWTPHGLEGDDTTSNRSMTFLERSSMSDAFYNQNFVTGIFQGNAILDQRLTYQSMLFVPNVAGNNSGDFFGDGEYGVVGRWTGLPYYANDGACLLHLGASGNWQHATRGNNETADPQFVRFSARPEQRDFASDFDGTTHDAALNPGDSNRLVDTGNIRADSFSIFGTEFYWMWGPLSVQAEYAFTAANAAVVGGKSVGDQWFNGGYVQVSYFLTGEHRAYDKRFGRFAGNYLVGPHTPFWFVRDENGRLNWGLGAWELAARFSYLDLNSAGNTIQGGKMDGVTLGVNWYLNPNFKIQFQYIYDNRYDLAPGVIPGYGDGLGIRTLMGFSAPRRPVQRCPLLVRSIRSEHKQGPSGDPYETTSAS